MSTSLVLLGEDGFWTTDSSLRVWLAFLVNEIEHMADPLEWSNAVVAKWREAALASPMGGVDAALGKIVDDTTSPVLQQLCTCALDRIGRAIDANRESVCLSTAGMIIDDPRDDVGCSTRVVQRVGMAFVALLSGKMKTGLRNLPFIPRGDDRVWNE